ncbi:MULTISPECIES: helicase associated domain-containing protein [unclassified Kitasatospora]|uniref:helicase associated domain-containing protein n=1 Tax=unclassified Kitasatospora TaxID=2633591 RepID=UPI003405A7F9
MAPLVAISAPDTAWEILKHRASQDDDDAVLAATVATACFRMRRNLAAAAQYRAREGHLNVPRKHKEPLVLADGSTVQIGLGLFVENSRRRRADIPADRAARLTELGMRWE